MGEAAEPTGKLLRPVRWRLFVGVGVALFCGIGGTKFVTSYWDFGSASGELDDAVREAKRLGLPLEASDMMPKPPVKPEENAAELIRQVGKALRGHSWSSYKYASLDKLNKADLAVLGKELEKFESALRCAEQAATKPKVDFGWDWDQSPVLVFPEYAQLKAAAKYLALRSGCRAYRGDVADALSDLRATRKMADFAGMKGTAGSTMIGLLVQDAVLAFLDVAEARVAWLWADHPERLSALRKVVEEPYNEPSFDNALLGEVWLGVSTGRNLAALGGLKFVRQLLSGFDSDSKFEMDMDKIRRSGLPKDSMGRALMARHLQFWNAEIEAQRRNPQGEIAFARSLDEHAERYQKKRGLSYRLDAALFPVFKRAAEQVVGGRAHRRVVASFVRVLEFRALHHRMPTSLAEAGAEAVDPCDGRPLRMKVVGDSVRVYSVGPDGKDDGGLSQAETHDSGKFDIVEAFPPIFTKP